MTKWITVGEICSRLRSLTKTVNIDSFLTNRLLYSLFSKHLTWLVRREDRELKLLRISSIIQTLSFVELIDVDNTHKTGSFCSSNIQTGITLKRTKYKLPEIYQGYSRLLITNVSSVDGSFVLKCAENESYYRIASRNKYNKSKYYWYSEGYLYFPNIDWNAINISALFVENIDEYNCSDCKNENCKNKSEKEIVVPAHLMGETESNVLKELSLLYQIPQDDIHGDTKSITR